MQKRRKRFPLVESFVLLLYLLIKSHKSCGQHRAVFASILKAKQQRRYSTQVERLLSHHHDKMSESQRYFLRKHFWNRVKASIRNVSAWIESSLILLTCLVKFLKQPWLQLENFPEFFLSKDFEIIRSFYNISSTRNWKSWCAAWCWIILELNICYVNASP